MQTFAICRLPLLWAFVATVAASSARGAPIFIGLGTLPGANVSSATAVSADGSTVVGVSAFQSPTTSGSEAFRWTAGDGMVGLGDLPGGDFSSAAYGVSGDGAVVVGSSRPGPGLQEAVYWTASSGMVGLGYLPGGGTDSVATAVSEDGSTIVGQSNSSAGREAYLWTSSGGMVGLGGLPGQPVDSIAYGVSADGSTVVGAVFTTALTEDGSDVAFVWTQSAGMLDLGVLPGGYESEARAVTPDGSIVVGASSTGTDVYEAIRWTQAGGMVGLGNLPSGSNSAANAVSADGSVIVGTGYDATSVRSRALVWLPGSGPRALQDVLVNDLGLDLTGWELTEAYGVSADGLTIIGNGWNPSGRPEAFLAFLPEPSTGLLLALGLAALARCRLLGSRRSD